ncbi:leucine rich repeats and iq motif containing 4 [Anaeramoeba ignava]|uniref:Leucine rich repeats and iq motif containing 4 n=1 Tax=Anaeramoeba ignava TaxID=1746090 RepID=A0A9Q0L8X5_ANAIG|nr:leucine rich repeats and iq motif containing 4 [Anaeramoeba ignava]
MGNETILTGKSHYSLQTNSRIYVPEIFLGETKSPILIERINCSEEKIEILNDNFYHQGKLFLTTQEMKQIIEDRKKNKKSNKEQENRLQNLKWIAATFCGIEKINPEFFHQVSQLLELDLSSNKLENIPKEIGNLKYLQTLNISHNKLNKIPDSITELKDLQVFNCSSNQIKSIGSKIIKNISSKITRIDFSYNLLTRLHKFRLLKELKYLDISHNKMIKFLQGLKRISSLIFLDLSFNQIESIPYSIKYFKRLQILNLSNNKISQISDSLCQLSNLETLILSSNLLTEIPVTLPLISTLKSIVLVDNPMRFPPINVCIQGKQAIVDYISNLNSEFEPSDIFQQEQKTENQIIYDLESISYIPSNIQEMNFLDTVSNLETISKQGKIEFELKQDDLSLLHSLLPNENLNENLNENSNLNLNQNQNLNLNLNQNLNENSNENSNENLNQYQNLNENLNENLNQNLNENLNQNLNENLIQNLNENLNQNSNENLNQNQEDDLDLLLEQTQQLFNTNNF